MSLDSLSNISAKFSEENTQQLNEFDFASARNFLRKKHDALQAKRFLLWEKASQDAQNIVEMIVQIYHPEKIIQWGSLLEPKHFSEASDIDLAIVGLDIITFMKLVADAEDLTTFPLDLVRWESIDPCFQKIILMKGKILYGER